jgi:hypothetical protein
MYEASNSQRASYINSRSNHGTSSNPLPTYLPSPASKDTPGAQGEPSRSSFKPRLGPSNQSTYVRQVIPSLADYGPLSNIVPEQVRDHLTYVRQTTLDRLRAPHAVYSNKRQISRPIYAERFSLTDYGPLSSVVPEQAASQSTYVRLTTLSLVDYRSSSDVVPEQAIRVSLETLSTTLRLRRLSRPLHTRHRHPSHSLPIR